jgi:hypothetical protein
MRRTLVAPVLATAFVLAAASAALAGGWATIQPDATAAFTEPRAGTPFDLGFTVLQHGETPADFVHPTARLTNVETGDTSFADTTNDGAGHYTASFTVQTAGQYEWVVTMEDLIVEMTPLPLTVLHPDGTVPPLGTAAQLSRIRTLVAGDVAASVGIRQTATEDRLVEVTRALDSLESQITALEAQVDAAPAGTDPAAADDSSALPTIVLAAAAGALAGGVVAFGLMGLAPRRRVEETAELAASTR